MQIVKSTFKTLLNSDVLRPIYCITDEHQGIEKQRIYKGAQQVCRIDYDKAFLHEKRVFSELYDAIDHTNSNSPIVISDYGKGLLTPAIIAKINDSGRKLYLDPHPNNDIFQYRNLHMIKLNEKELQHFTKSSDMRYGCRKLMEATGAKHVFVTMNKDGMFYMNDKEETHHVESKVKWVKTVEGAGDVVFASLVTDMEAGLEIKDAMERASALVAIS